MVGESFAQASAPIAPTEATIRAEQKFTSYAFAHELGSGVYDLGGRTLQVYRLSFTHDLRPTNENTIGAQLTLPLTFGFLDFTPADVIDNGLPRGIDSLSFVPGLSLDVELDESWNLRPYVKGGASLSDVSDVDALLYGTGVVAEYLRQRPVWLVRINSEFIYSAVDFRAAELRDDDFIRWRHGIDTTRGTGTRLGRHEVEAGLFGVLDAYVDPPQGPLTGADIPRLQLELGFTFGLRPPWRVWRLPVPRVGVSYRFAGDVSAWRLVLGVPY